MTQNAHILSDTSQTMECLLFGGGCRMVHSLGGGGGNCAGYSWKKVGNCLAIATNTWGHQTVTIVWKKRKKYPTTQDTWPKDYFMPQTPSCNMLSRQKEKLKDEIIGKWPNYISHCTAMPCRLKQSLAPCSYGGDAESWNCSQVAVSSVDPHPKRRGRWAIDTSRLPMHTVTYLLKSIAQHHNSTDILTPSIHYLPRNTQ